MIQAKETTRLRGIYYGGPVLGYAALIYFLSSLSRFPEAVPSFFGFDKLAHFIEYFIFGCLLYRWFSISKRLRGRGGAFLVTLFVGMGYAISDEWHQSFVPGRDASFFDALFDTAGIAVAAAIYPYLHLKICGKGSKSQKRSSHEQSSCHYD